MRRQWQCFIFDCTPFSQFVLRCMQEWQDARLADEESDDSRVWFSDACGSLVTGGRYSVAGTSTRRSRLVEGSLNLVTGDWRVTSCPVRVPGVSRVRPARRGTAPAYAWLEINRLKTQSWQEIWHYRVSIPDSASLENNLRFSFSVQDECAKVVRPLWGRMICIIWVMTLT